MTKHEFAAVMGYIGAAVGKEIGKPQLVVYYDLLGDLDANVFLAAAKAALLSSEYPTVPTAGALRQQAARIVAGEEVGVGEAWALVLKTVRAPGKRREEMKASLPARVRRAAELIGWEQIGAATDKIGSRMLFEQTYRGLSERQERERLLPPAARQVIEGCFQMPAMLPAPKQEQGRLF